MSTPAIRNLAQQVQKLTYDEMIEIADWLSQCTGVDEDGENIPRKISTHEMASNLSAWADDNMDE
jgi:hypothetical protein